MHIEPRDWKQAAFFGVILAIAAAAIWYPAHRHRAAVDREIAELREGLGLDGSDAGQSVADLQKDVMLLQTRIEGRHGHVPASPGTAEVYAAVTQAFFQTDAADREVVTSTPRPYRDYGVVPVRVDFTGGFFDAYTVLQRIEDARRLLRVDRIEIERTPRDPDALRVQLDVSAFYTEGAAP